MFSLILLVFAFALLMIAVFVTPAEPWRSKLVCFGLACWVLAELVRSVPLVVK